MNAYNFCVLFFGFCTFFVSILILLKSPNRVGKRYFLFSTAVTVWAIATAVMMGENVSFNVAMNASRVLNVAALFIPVTWFQFLLSYLNLSGYKKLIRLNYVIIAFLICISPTKLFLLDVQPILGFKHYTVLGSLYHIYTFIYFTFIPFSFVVLYKRIKQLEGLEKKRMKLFFVATAPGFLGGMTTFFSGYGIMLPPYGFFIMPIYPFVMAYILIRTHMFDEQQLSESLRREKLATMSVLTASMSHEVRNPLYVIQGLLESSRQDGKLDKESLDKVFTKCLEQTNRASEIVKRFSAFVKPLPQEEYKESLDLNQTLSNVFLLIQYEIKSLKIEFQQAIPEGLKVIANKMDLEEILLNLILNCCQALKGEVSPKLLVEAKEQGEKIEIKIQDNGPGIQVQPIEKIFEPFHTTKQEGMGLGLFITKTLVEKNGGEISVASNADSGTTFFLQLPHPSGVAK